MSFSDANVNFNVHQVKILSVFCVFTEDQTSQSQNISMSVLMWPVLPVFLHFLKPLVIANYHYKDKYIQKNSNENVAAAESSEAVGGDHIADLDQTW